jgi:hypothetical protein
MQEGVISEINNVASYVLPLTLLRAVADASSLRIILFAFLYGLREIRVRHHAEPLWRGHRELPSLCGQTNTQRRKLDLTIA